MAKLTIAKVKSLKEPGRYGDGGGLYLVITKTGSRNWIQRIVLSGKRTDRGIGGYPAVSLAQARRKAAANKSAVANGINPWEEEETVAPIFSEAARIVHELNVPRWKNAKHAKSWLQTLERHAFPVIGDTPVDQVGQREVLRVLTPIWTEIPESARRVRQRMRTVFKWAMANDIISYNPAGEAVDGALPPMPKVKNHMRALPYQQVAEALRTVDNGPSNVVTKLAFKFLVLTAARSIEVRGALSSEIDHRERIWRIPPDRMKDGEEHRVPLSDQAVAVLSIAMTLSESRLLFPSFYDPDKMLSENALSLMLRKRGIEAVPHGFRSSFRDWAAEQTSASHAAMELSLAHRVGSTVEQAYFRSDLFEQRRELMQQWADYLGEAAWPQLKNRGI
ncbi:MAG: integrase arm-type DNA-binding domain-containing protein [Dehalococcoidia bacterium]|nr:integrase arm-type DNA-binding domain-containing protein [Dehalococcoidia bacterium]